MGEITPPEIVQADDATETESPAVEATQEAVNEFAGLPHGSVIDTNHEIRVLEEPGVVGLGAETATSKERIVEEKDEDGNVIAWHKEPLEEAEEAV